MELVAGDVAVVTGAASGIGFALAERFATAGLHVVAADVDPEALEGAVTRLSAHGADVLGVVTDVSKEGDVQALAQATIERFGGVQIVCNNAGVGGLSDPWFGPTATWEWVLGVNLWGVIHGIRAFLPHLALAGRGHMVNTASIAGLLPGFTPPYDASKHAVVAITEDLHNDMRSAGVPVGVSVLCPGWVRTGIMDSERNWPRHLGEQPPEAPGQAAVKHHFRRAIDEATTPAAVAELVASAITEDRFWVFPHADWVELAARRWERIIEGLDPERPTQMPGMPPTSQIIDEVTRALAPPEPRPS